MMDIVMMVPGWKFSILKLPSIYVLAMISAPSILTVTQASFSMVALSMTFPVMALEAEESQDFLSFPS
jgi:hypothetical protein